MVSVESLTDLLGSLSLNEYKISISAPASSNQVAPSSSSLEDITSLMESLSLTEYSTLDSPTIRHSIVSSSSLVEELIPPTFVQLAISSSFLSSLPPSLQIFILKEYFESNASRDVVSRCSLSKMVNLQYYRFIRELSGETFQGIETEQEIQLHGHPPGNMVSDIATMSGEKFRSSLIIRDLIPYRQCALPNIILSKGGDRSVLYETVFPEKSVREKSFLVLLRKKWYNRKCLGLGILFKRKPVTPFLWEYQLVLASKGTCSKQSTKGDPLVSTESLQPALKRQRPAEF
ncbi:hypothetical protein ACHQM5_011148 [Ranunculus cassubicifolius]